MAETPQTANYVSERDILAEAGAILRGETRRIVTIEHLKAIVQLLKTGMPYVAQYSEEHPRGLRDHVSPSDWLHEAVKVMK